MDEPVYRILKYAAIAMALAWAAWFVYDGFVARIGSGDYGYHAAARLFADGRYERALAEYDAALREHPGHIAALRGRAETLIMLGREPEAIAIYDRLAILEPDYPGHYANRGIAYDRLGRHAEALADYEKALSLDPRVGEGPDWLTRFLRNQPDRLPGIADRARYLRTQLALPPSQRLLRVPAFDEAQRPFKK